MRKTPPEELLPPSITQKLGMPSLAEAIRYLHRPPPDADVEPLLAGEIGCRHGRRD